jgi:hypothetical protein
MTFITVRNVGAYGFNTTPLNGIGLSTADAATTRSEVDQALALADALRDAMQAARQAGLQAFAPAQAVAAGVLTLPTSLTTTNRDAFFANVMGRAWAGGPVSLDQWSQAVEELEHWAGATASMLPPGAGGGTRNVRGTWYVNGEPWSLSELFTVNRVNTLSEIDRMVAESLNVIAANNDAAKALTGLMQKLFEKYYAMDPGDRVSRTEVNTLGLADPDYPVSFDRLLGYADKHIGSGSNIRKMGSLDLNIPAYSASATYVPGVRVKFNSLFYQNNNYYSFVGSLGEPPSLPHLWDPADGFNLLTKEDFRAMIDEVEQILGAFSADNQVAQLRNETLFNSRSNLLEGLGTFLKGQQTTRSTVARNA